MLPALKPTLPETGCKIKKIQGEKEKTTPSEQICRSDR
jgi:hypothetical protein